MSDPVSHSSSGSSEGPAAGPSSSGSGNGSSGGSASGAGQSRSAARADARGGLFDRLRHLIGGWRSTGSLRDDLAEALSTSVDTGSDLTATERSMLKSILDLRELRIGDVMVPRADIIAVQKDITLGELLAVFADAGHSRLVVYDDTLDDPVGMVHIRDLVTYLTQRAMMPRRGEARNDARSEAKNEPKSETGRTNGEGAKERPHMRGWDLAHPLPAFNLKAIDLSATLSAAKLIRRLLFVPPSMPSIELLASMQASRIHLALVVDEYGGTDGIVSMEDLVEEIVGDIEDEHDDDETPLIARQADGSFIADARASLEDVAEMIDPAFAAGEEAEEVDTLGGLLVTIAGRVPVRGEIVPGPGQFEIEVLDADPRRVKRLRISRAGEGDAPVRRASAPSEERDREDSARVERSGAASLPPPAEQASDRRPETPGKPNEAA